MDCCYNFHQEAKPELFEFLESANKHRNNKFCSVKEYEHLRRFFRMNSTLEKEYNEFCHHHKTNTIITINDDTEYIKQASDQVEIINKSKTVTSTLDITNSTAIEDMVFVVKDNLEMEKKLNENSMLLLMECDDAKLNELFKKLNLELNLEHILNLGNSIKNVGVRENIISSFLEHLLLNMPQLQFNVIIRDVFKEISLKYPSTVKCIIVKKLSSEIAEQDEYNTLLRYVSDLNDDVKSDILGEFLSMCTSLNLSNIAAITNVLNPSVKQEQIHMLVEVMSKNADEFNSDKAFGKLLIDIIKIPNKIILASFEQPLKQLINSHRSIWKGKLLNLFTQQFSLNNDSTLYTQSMTCR